MEKQEELRRPNSCINRAKFGEQVFVLLARDVTAPQVIRFWIDERIRMGKNRRMDSQIQEAEQIASEMEAYYDGLQIQG